MALKQTPTSFSYAIFKITSWQITFFETALGVTFSKKYWLNIVYGKIVVGFNMLLWPGLSHPPYDARYKIQ